MAVVRWKFYDGSTAEEHTFEINPNAGGSLEYEKNLIEQNTCAPGGRTLIFEGADNPPKLEFSGPILTESQHVAFLYWWNKRRQIRITDDLGREYWVYITSYKPVRKRSYLYPWRHDYTMTCTVLSW